ncbi:KilA-N domain-containing protein [Candidatus Saccharibacteria bacterium]|nr:KilA-N domain-containing protein [Candidatus Saccharibacteria bacterium]
MNNIIETEIEVIDTRVGIKRIQNVDYISLTDLARHANGDDPSGVIRNWMSNKNSFEFYGFWEELNNPDFNSVEFHGIKTTEAPYNRFTMTPSRWKKEFNAIGIIPSSGKYSSGTYAHPDIAFEFASWLNPEFKVYLIREFERLRRNEAYNNQIEWHANRALAKANYTIHTDAIKNKLIPTLSDGQIKYIYANEADVLNMALFGMTAKEWREKNPERAKGENIRDSANLLQLIILNNLENLNAEFIKEGIPQSERLERLNAAARDQVRILTKNRSIAELTSKSKQIAERT